MLRLVVISGAVAAAGWSYWQPQQSTGRVKAEQSVRDGASSAPAMTVTAMRPADFAPRDLTPPATGNPAVDEVVQQLRTQLSTAIERLQQMPGYTATVEQQVKVGDALREEEIIDVKIRREPFGVYMKWRRDGQEALYVDGENDGRLLARPTRGIAALRGTWKLRPHSPQAMRDSRYPMTEMGAEKLCRQIVDFYDTPQFKPETIEAKVQAVQFRGEDCQQFEIVFRELCEGLEYSRSILIFSEKTGLLRSVENYCWSEDGQPAGLLEKYVYHDIQAASFAENEFDPQHPDYNF